jgi:GNAT superfamily N-acetyltransferase
MLDIRPLRPDERAAWEPLWQGYLTFYKASLTPEVTEVTWARLQDPAEPMHVLGAFLDNASSGFTALHLPPLDLVDGRLLLSAGPVHRRGGARQGAGRALIEAVYERAREAGASRVYWLTHESNEVARGLYDKVADRSGFIQYRRVF